MKIALEIVPDGVALVTARWVRVAGERLALHHPVALPDLTGTDRPVCAYPHPLPGWQVTDPETGRAIARGATPGEALSEAQTSVWAAGPAGLLAARDRILASQWGLQ